MGRFAFELAIFIEQPGINLLNTFATHRHACSNVLTASLARNSMVYTWLWLICGYGIIRHFQQYFSCIVG